ncbi:armadillo-type protein [Entophlyctis helioformis]|nr:armadillo-type protein [Entophlyctis helioformis]
MAAVGSHDAMMQHEHPQLKQQLHEHMAEAARQDQIPRTQPNVVLSADHVAPQLGLLMPAEETALLASTLPKDADSTKCQLAYGRHAIPKLVSQLEETKLFARQKALVFLADLFHCPDNVVQAIDESVVILLLSFLDTEDLTSRQKATEALNIIACCAVGRTDLIKRNALQQLSRRFDDADDLVRKHVYDTFAKVTIQREGVESLMSAGLFLPIIQRLPGERMDIQVPMLETCYNCIRLGAQPAMPSVALGCPAMDVFTELARKSLVSDVKVAACRCIMMLSFFHEGKRLASEGDTVLVLIALLSDRKSDVRASAAGALMSITIDCNAKRIMVRENALTVLTDLLNDTNELVLLNVIKTITNCAEDYRGRFQLHHSIRKWLTVERMAAGPSRKVAKWARGEAAKQAIAVISWRP